MSLIINGITAPQDSRILKVNSLDVDDLQVNGVSVWRYLPEILIGADLHALASNSGSATFNKLYTKPAGYSRLYVESYYCGEWCADWDDGHWGRIYGVNGGSQTLLYEHYAGGYPITIGVGELNITDYAQIRVEAYVRSNYYSVSAGFKNVKWLA